MVDIPYDVWKHVTDFLPSDDVKNLLTINHALFNIAMDERYKSSLFGSLFHPSTLLSLRRLSDPQVANRVRVFKFIPGHLFRLLKEGEESASLQASAPSSTPGSTSLGSHSSEQPSGSNRSRRRHVIRGATSSTQRFGLSTSGTTGRSMGSIIKQPPIAPDQALEQLTIVMANLTSLITLQVEIRGEEHYYMADSKALIFDFTWPAIASSLRNLELRIPMEDMVLVLPDHKETALTRLESLYLRIIRASLSTAEQPIILDILLPFLTAHRASLRSLTLDIAEQTDLSVFLLTAHLPHLREFKLKIPLASPTDRRFTALQSFFRSHRTQLTAFDIELLATFTHQFADQTFFDQDHFTTYRPKLQHLSITTPSHSASMKAYILQFRWTLVSLRVHNSHRWSLELLRTLVEAFLPTGTLKRLDVAVFEFSPELLVALAINLPNLDVLSLDIESVIPQGTTYSTSEAQDVPQFCHVMGDVVFSQWQLKTLITTPLHVVHAVRALYKKAVVRSLPNVTNFSGMGRKAYLETPVFI